MISFKQSDLDELRNSCRYLSDVFIEFYFTYLSSIHPSDSILFVPPSITFLLASFKDKKEVADCVKPLELHTKDLIFFPVNDGGIHWSLLVYYRDLNVFAHHDSLGGLNDEEAEELYIAVRQCVHEREGLRCRLGFGKKRRHVDGPSVPVYKRPVTPRQKNGYDCGLYVMAMAEAICGWFCSGVREETWMRQIEKVDDSVGMTMRPLVLQLIRDASEGRLGSVSCTIEEERRDGKLIRDASEGKLGSVSCTIEEERRDGKLIRDASEGRLGSVSCTIEEEERRDGKLIRDASEGRLGSVSCSIEEERRDGNMEEGLTKDEIELHQFWADFDNPVDSQTTISPDLPPLIAVGKMVLDDYGKKPLIKEEAGNDKDMGQRLPSCDSTSTSSSIGR